MNMVLTLVPIQASEFYPFKLHAEGLLHAVKQVLQLIPEQLGSHFLG